MGRFRALRALLLALIVTFGFAGIAVADDPPADDPPVVDPPLEVDPGGPAPDVRKRPPPPPPPGVAIPEWDLDHLNATVLPPALPKPMPFELRNIRFRHDTRVASADGRRTPLKRIPQWVDIIERSDLTEWRPKDIGFLARRMPNVTVGDAGNPFLQIPGIRGLTGDRIKILTDGVWPGTQALGSQGSTLSLWDPESTERVEIYHGPGAYLRAIDSPGGFINIVPRRPRQHGPFSADFRGSLATDTANRKYRGRAEIDFGQERVAVLAGVTWTTASDRTTGTGTLEPTDYDQIAADFAIDYFLGPNARLGLTTQYMSATGISSPVNSGNVSQPAYDRLFIGISLSTMNIGPVFHGTRISFAIDSIIQDDDLLIEDEAAGIGNEDNISRYDFQVQGALDLFCCHTTWAQVGVSWGRLDREETLLCVDPDEGVGGGDTETPGLSQGFLIGDPRIRPHAELDNCVPVTRKFEAEELVISGLFTDEYHNGCYDIYAGLRGDYYHVRDAQDGSADKDELLLGGALGAAFHVTQRTSYYGNLSAGWRRPTLFELGAIEIVNGDPIFSNELLDPEFHGNAELGVKTSFKNTWSLQGAVFTHYIDETIAPSALGGGGGFLLQNLGDVFLYGAEITGACRPCRTFEGLEFFASLGITDSTDEDLVPDVPLQYRAGGRYSVPSPKGYVVRRWFSELQFYGETDSRFRSVGGGGYVTGDFIVGGQVDFGRGRWGEVNLGVTNLMNSSYTPATALFKAPGLSVFLSIGFDI